ncbi:MAG: citrate/2-methylcitrate synthase, partial [Gallicola sp.]|nr:citrate/2-methylcitrate synthase [Gallicola sp.]
MNSSLQQPNIQQIESKLLNLLEKNSYVNPKLYTEYNIKRGLRNSNGTGVLVGITRIANVEGYVLEDGKKIPTEGRLLYRGIPLNDIVKGFQMENRYGFEETVYLLLLGELPSKQSLENFEQMLERYKTFPKFYNEDMIYKSVSKNIMNMMQRTVLSLYNYDDDPENLELLNTLRQSIDIIAKLPLLMAYCFNSKRHYYDSDSLIIHRPKPGAGTAENILHMLRKDSQYTEEEARLLDLCLVVHAEHGGGNNSAFATHVVSSSGTDMYSAIATAIGSLKGPKHGGANIMVAEMLDNIKENCN